MLTGQETLTGRKSLVGRKSLYGYSGIGKFSGVPIPAGALLYYLFSQSNLSNAITEQVGKVNAVYTTRASNINLKQTLSGQVVMYAAGVAAFDRGQNMNVSPSGTNKCTNYNFAPTDFTNVTQAGLGSFSVGSAYSSLLAGIQPSNGDSYIVDNSGQGAASSLTFGGVAGNVNAHSLSARVYVISGSATVGRTSTAVDAVTVNANSGFIRTKIEGFTADATDSLIVTATAGAVIAVVANQLEESSVSTPEIVTSGATGVRAPTAESISTFTTPAYWIDSPLDGGGVNPCVVGHWDGDGYTGGVNTSQGRLIFSSDQIPAITGKYVTLVSSGFTNAIATLSNGVILRLTHRNTTSVFYTLIKNETGLSDAVAVQQGAENDGTSSNPFTVDFTPSAIFTGSLAADSLAVFNLRVDADDLPADLNALGVPALLDTSSFRAGPEVFELSLSSGAGTLWKSGDSSLVYDKAANQIQAKTLANTAVIAVPDLSLVTSAYFVYDGVNIYPIVNGVSGVGVASTEPVLGADFELMQDGAGGGYFDSPNIVSFYGGAI